MKYRLVDLLQCVKCHGEIEVSAEKTQSVAQASGATFSCDRYCNLDRSAQIPPPERCAECSGIDIETGTLSCRRCGAVFPIVQSVPWLLDQALEESDRLLADTARLYSHLWSQASPGTLTRTHLHNVEEALGEPVVQGKIGLDAGSGSGKDTAMMARRHPSVEVISLEVSEGVYETRRRTEGLPNVHVVRASVLALPLRSGVCDFGYSFGVLHHTSDPRRGLQEIVRVLKTGGRASLYLYEDHADNLFKAIPLKLVAALRRVTTRLNTRVLSGLCYFFSPFVVIAFSIPAKIMFRYRATCHLAERMPFNFGTSLFSVHGDLMDRFGAPIEFRFSQARLLALLRACDLTGLRTTKMKDTAGWVASGKKADATELQEVVNSR